MIKAIVKNGAIQPLDVLPENWAEGQELFVESFADHPVGSWVREVEEAMSGVSDEDHALLREAVSEHRLKAKEQMRREMSQ